MLLYRLDGFDMIPLRSCDRVFREFIMAVQSGNVSFEFSVMERGWIRQCVETQRKVLLRSRLKEIAGGEIWQLRGKEIDALTALLAKVSV